MPHYPFGLRPKSPGVIIDNTFRLYRRNFPAIALFGLLIGGLGQLLTQLVLIPLLGGAPAEAYQDLMQTYAGMLSDYPGAFEDMAGFYQDFGTFMSASFAVMLLNLIVTIFVTSFVIGGIVNIAAGYAHGFTDKPTGWLRRNLSQYGRLTLTGLARLLLTGVNIFALFIGAVILIVVFALAAFVSPVITVVGMLAVILAAVALASWTELLFPVALVENKFGFQGIGRAFSLFFRNFWRMSGLLILVWLITMVVNLPLSLVTTILPLRGMTDPNLLSAGVYWLAAILSVLVSALTTPVAPIAVTLAYLDLRVRREGYDIALRQRDQAQRADGPRDNGGDR